ncbi:MAG: GntR family transcriptional regulator [Allorhizobium sp.]
MAVQNLNLVESLYADIRQKLQFSEVGPQDRLVDTEIAEAYGTSRMPAREALLRLVAEGYLVGSTRGFVLPTLSEDDIIDLFELRRQLEPRAAAAAARDLTAAAESALRDAMEAISTGHAQADIGVVIRANVAFRTAWISAVRNRHMAATISRFMDYFQAIRLETFADPATRLDYVAALQALFEAFIGRDPLAAHDRMTAFLFAAETAYLSAHTTQLQSETAQKGRGARRKLNAYENA